MRFALAPFVFLAVLFTLVTARATAETRMLATVDELITRD